MGLQTDPSRQTDRGPSGPFVLVADDDPLIQTVMERSLGAAGYHVECVDDGERLLERLQRRRPDILVLDVFMPIIDGFEAMRRIRADPELADLPIVVVSALKRPADLEMARSLKVAAYVPKPFSPADLTRELRAICPPRRQA
jgi:CheY-like chemotaxis protein